MYGRNFNTNANDKNYYYNDDDNYNDYNNNNNHDALWLHRTLNNRSTNTSTNTVATKGIWVINY